MGILISAAPTATSALIELSIRAFVLSVIGAAIYFLVMWFAKTDFHS